MTDLQSTLERAIQASALGARARTKRDVGDRLRSSALDLFMEKGYDAVTVNEIADRAGVTPRTFFRHFPTKETIVLDLTDMTNDRLVRIVRQCESTSILDVLQQSLAEWFEEFADLFDVVKLLTKNSDTLRAAVLLRQTVWEPNLATALAAHFPELDHDAVLLWGSLAYALLLRSEDYALRHQIPISTAVPEVFTLFSSHIQQLQVK
ncbi:TetR/AcrR family transcriptional regulator [Arthrobacter sp. W4I7]|uniref:TetR/AcrR family transcriptional regulator n=1 Tax=Arthrobacter sp. W4I7 TaxID=3042296 RepID=UPI00277DAEF9|nr:TetR/AcrR family transcriptional regulator [Arthrobacter sp. W4I7]MDQ0691433.1 AcrR family transcriptional regulator [Arthrobacter sp. W4I7]